MRLTLLPLILLAACALPRREAPPPPEPAVSVTEAPGADVLHPRARPGVAEPPSAGTAAGLLGETLAGLGAPGEAGLWLSTGLVSAARPGRVTSASGQSAAVELRPSGAAPTVGSHLSLAAMRALGLPLGQLATIRVFAD